MQRPARGTRLAPSLSEAGHRPGADARVVLDAMAAVQAAKVRRGKASPAVAA